MAPIQQRKRAVIIGGRNLPKRNIGGELTARLRASTDWYVAGTVSSKGVQVFHQDSGPSPVHEYDPNNRHSFREFLKVTRPDVGFVCIPATEQGLAATRYIEDLLGSGAVVSTAEKSSTAWQPEIVMPNIDQIDVSAVFGGGNRFAYNPKLQHLNDRKVEIYAILNATLNFASQKIADGLAPDDVVQQAINNSIAEPPKDGKPLTFEAMVRGELDDVALKTCAFYGILLARDGKYLKPDMLKGSSEARDADIEAILSKSTARRMIVRFANFGNGSIEDERTMLLPRHASVNGWHISLGYREIGGGSALSQWVSDVPEINNSILAYVDGKRFVAGIGPGAGFATVDAMIEGALDRLKYRALVQRLKAPHEQAA